MNTQLLTTPFNVTVTMVKPVITTIVPNEAESSSISVIATLDLTPAFPKFTNTRITSQYDMFFGGDPAPRSIIFTSAIGDETILNQKEGGVFGEFFSDDGSMSLAYSPLTGKCTIKSGNSTAISDESYPSVEAIGNLTFKTSMGGVMLNYGSSKVSDIGKFVKTQSGGYIGTASAATVNLLANHQTKGISSVQTSLVIPAGCKITHNAPETSKVYITF